VAGAIVTFAKTARVARTRPRREPKNCSTLLANALTKPFACSIGKRAGHSAESEYRRVDGCHQCGNGRAGASDLGGARVGGIGRRRSALGRAAANLHLGPACRPRPGGGSPATRPCGGCWSRRGAPWHGGGGGGRSTRCCGDWWRTAIEAVASPAAPRSGGWRSTTCVTWRTAARRCPRTSPCCARATAATTTGDCSESPATPPRWPTPLHGPPGAAASTHRRPPTRPAAGGRGPRPRPRPGQLARA
jgi:hypothetical protein